MQDLCDSSMYRYKFGAREVDTGCLAFAGVGFFELAKFSAVILELNGPVNVI